MKEANMQSIQPEPSSPLAGTLTDAVLALLRQGFPIEVCAADANANEILVAVSVLGQMGWSIEKSMRKLPHERDETTVFALAEELDHARIQRRWGYPPRRASARAFKISSGGYWNLRDEPTPLAGLGDFDDPQDEIPF